MPPGKSFKSLLIASLWLTDLKTKEKILGVQVWGRRAPLEGWRSNTWTTHPTPLPQARLSWPQGETWGDKILLYFRYVEPKKLKLKNRTQRRVGGTGENDQKEQNSSYRIIKSWGCKVKKKKGGEFSIPKNINPREGDNRRQWHPAPVLLPGKSHGRRSLAGCHSWGSTELDTTEAT